MAYYNLDDSADRNKNFIGALQGVAEQQLKRQQLLQEAQKGQQQYKLDRAKTATENKLNLAKARRFEQGGGIGTPRFMQDEEGNFVPLPGILVETPQQKLERKTAGSTADIKNQLQSNQNAGLVFEQLKDLSSGLQNIGGFEGLAIKGGNIVSRGALNPQARAYMDFAPAAAVNLYRGITGDTRLSDYDAKRAYSLIWDIDESGAIKGIKEESLGNLLKARNVLLSNNVYATRKEDKITSLDDTVFVSNAISKGVSEDEILSYLKSRKKK